MTSILEDLYYGNIRPNEVGFSKDSPYAKKLNELVNCQEKLNRVLEGSDMECFHKYCDAQSELNAMSAARDFIYGFCLGAKFMIEITKENDGDFFD
ncbi:MAG: hypothetical protein PHO15_02075 [Eubacteriales bacterium]|nr:hypothetical protein [Eubacteriales bacterium]